MRWFSLILILLPLVGCGGDDEDTSDGAGDTAAEQFEMFFDGQFGRVWDQLHPAHQEVVPRDLYVECSSQQTFPDMEIGVEEVYEETMDVARVGPIDTMAVTLNFTNNGNSQTITEQLVEVDGEWRWILEEEALAAFEAGECP